MGKELKDKLFNTEAENPNEDSKLPEPVDLNELFKSVDFNKTTAIIERAEKEMQKKASRVSSSRGRSRNKGIINESYLRELIREEVYGVFEDFKEELMEEIKVLKDKQAINTLKDG